MHTTLVGPILLPLNRTAGTDTHVLTDCLSIRHGDLTISPLPRFLSLPLSCALGITFIEGRMQDRSTLLLLLLLSWLGAERTANGSDVSSGKKVRGEQTLLV